MKVSLPQAQEILEAVRNFGDGETVQDVFTDVGLYGEIAAAEAALTRAREDPDHFYYVLIAHKRSQPPPPTPPEPKVDVLALHAEGVLDHFANHTPADRGGESRQHVEFLADPVSEFQYDRETGAGRVVLGPERGSR